MKSTIKASVICEIVFGVVLIFMEFIGMFEDIFSALVFGMVLLSVIPLATVPCIRHYKTGQSSVFISVDCIRVSDKNGVCWREIPYGMITGISVEEVCGFFYGQHRDQTVHKYICLYLNGSTQIPDAPYAELFMHKDFFMVYYQKTLMDELQNKRSKTGDGSVIPPSPQQNR